MHILLFSLIALGIITALITIIGRHRRSAKGEAEQAILQKEDEEEAARRVLDMECCGQHEVCEKEELLKALAKGIEYYDDEELDRYSRRAADSYSETEADEFREVLYTMKPAEVAGWVRSLQLRGIELPSDVRDEALFVMEGE